MNTPMEEVLDLFVENIESDSVVLIWSDLRINDVIEALICDVSDIMLGSITMSIHGEVIQITYSVSYAKNCISVGDDLESPDTERKCRRDFIVNHNFDSISELVDKNGVIVKDILAYAELMKTSFYQLPKDVRDYIREWTNE